MVAHGSITAKIVPGPALYSPESKRVKYSDCGIHLETHKTVEPIRGGQKIYQRSWWN